MDIYQNQFIDTLKLNNQSGAVVKVGCLYKEGQSGKSERAKKESSSFPVGQSQKLDLNQIEDLVKLANMGREMWVTVYVNVVAGKDDQGQTWFRFKPNCKRTAVFTISGVINFTDVGFNSLEDTDKK